MSSEKISIVKLKGSINYEVWALRTKALLTKEGQIDTIFNISNDAKNLKALSNIQLLIEDGPLLQIQEYTTAKEAWDALKNLYYARGFSSEFLICREFFNTSLNKYPSMEEYLNKVKYLSDQLKAKNIELPRQVIIAWVLNNLSEDYENIISNITQTLRNDINAYSLENLFSNLIDESKRQESNKDKSAFISTTSFKKYKGKKPYKITKGKYCNYCKQTTHIARNCYFLWPEKAPNSFKFKESVYSRPENRIKYLNSDESGQSIREHNIDIMFTNIENKAIKKNSLNKEGREYKNDAIDTNYRAFNNTSPFISTDNGDIQVNSTNSTINDINLDYEIEDINYQVNLYNSTYNISTNKTSVDLNQETICYNSKNQEEEVFITSTPIIINNNRNNTKFILDTAATKHVICNKAFFADYKSINKLVK